tara:strand:+ start:1056 stop:3821 length:2766 start_codon:yes stop_codon:yes gene_type:complete
MPKYLITDELSGRTKTVEGNSPPSEDQIKEIFAVGLAGKKAERGYRPGGPLGNYMNPSDHPISEGAHDRMIEGGLRYGVPALATMAAGPGAGMLAVAGIGAASGAAGSLAAQGLEVNRGAREGYDVGEIASDTILSATPFKGTGGLFARAGTNVGLSLGTQELASLARGEGNVGVKEGAIAALSGMLSLGGQAGGSVAKKQPVGAAVSKARQGGNVALMEVYPSQTNLEGRLYATDDVTRKIIDDMDAGLSRKTITDFADNVEDPAIAKGLYALSETLAPVQKRVNNANKALVEAEAALVTAKELRFDNLPQVQHARNQAAFEAVTSRYAREGAVRSVVPNIGPDMSGIARGTRNKRLAAVSGAATNAVKSGMDDLWGQVGLGLNDKQIMRGDLLKSIKFNRQTLLQGRDAKKDFMEEAIATFDGKQSITRERYTDFRDRFAKRLADKGTNPNKANKMAAEAYTVLKKSADRFIAGSLRTPAQKAAWKRFNSVSSGYFSARGEKVIELIGKGDADGLVKVLSEGKGMNLDALNTYTKSIEKAAGPEAASFFRKDVNSLIADGIVDSSVINGKGLAGAEAINTEKLVSTLETLRSSGYPMKELGLGSPGQIRQLSQLAAGGQYSRSQISKIIQDLPAVGYPAARGRADYYNALRESILKDGGGGEIRKNARLRSARSRAKLSLQEAEAMEASIRLDPMVALLEDTGMKLSADPIRNIGHATKIIDSDGPTTKAFVKAMKDSGRGAELERVKDSAVAGMMMSFYEEAVGMPPKLKIKEINKFFTSPLPDVKRKREALRGLMGEGEFSKLKAVFADETVKIGSTRATLGNVRMGMADSPRVVFSESPIEAGARVSYGGAIQFITRMQRAGRYQTLRALVLGPNSEKFAKAGYVLENYAATSPVNATVVKLLQDKEDKAAAEGQR